MATKIEGRKRRQKNEKPSARERVQGSGTRKSEKTGARPTRQSRAIAVAKSTGTSTTAARAAGTKKKPAPPTREGSLDLYRALVAAHPDAHCELDHRSPFELIVATVLSAQATDVLVNRVTPALFQAYPKPEALASADPTAVEALIGRLGMFRQKAKNIIGLARGLVADHGGQVPRSLRELVALPGVGRKTANVVLGVAFGQPEGVVVDTHVSRLAQRLGFSRQTAPEKIEQDLMRLLPQSEWDRASHTLIFHGRRVCAARKPACSTCPVSATCPSAFHAESVGRKPPRDRS